jgi:serine/threonine-protein kinase
MHAQPEVAPGALLAAGTCLGKYQVVRLIGEGGMGAVYEAVHLAIGKKVAIKVMSPALADNLDARARFLREAQLTSRVRHPHAVDVTDVGSEAGQTFLVMELLEGEDLASFIDWRGRLPLDQAADIMLAVSAAVAAAHDEGIIHRDLKPHNIFLSQTRDGAIVPKVVDFGISKGPTTAPDPHPAVTPALVMSPLVKTTVGLMGTPAYLAPEQIEGPLTVSAASDQYALGIILYQCVTGRPAFSSNAEVTKLFGDILNGNRTPADELRWDLPEGFQRIIDRATSRDPAARFPSVRAFGKALLPYASPKAALTWASTFSDREVPASATPPSSTSTWRRVFGRWIGTALMAICAAGTIVWGTMRAPAPLTIETTADVTQPAVRTTLRPAPRRIVIPPESAGLRRVHPRNRLPSPRGAAVWMRGKG